MTTTTKKELIDSIAEETGQSRTAVKRTVQSFLNQVIRELSDGNRLEFRDFGVFEVRRRAERTAQNPRTLEPIVVPACTTVKFKAGRLMRMALDGEIDLESLTPLDDSEFNDRHQRTESADATRAGSDVEHDDEHEDEHEHELEYEVLASGQRQRR